ncbi:hypothetical protein F443_04730 [Phytophthora nicotianae P1569]|uniref:RxLR effector protein n=1 Tax=Phytophthora nicotianae P1569 TaxID=1317065 RepID=V9FKS4_PHYNI|nr:hypothetical protein F443_04730 [Phytophthora nicotianae P1569]
MIRLSVLLAVAGITLNHVDAVFLRQHESVRDLSTLETSESGSTDALDSFSDRFLASIDSSSGFGDSDDSGEGVSVDRLLVQDVISSDLTDESVDGSTFLGRPTVRKSLDSSEEVDNESNVDVTASEDSEDDSEDNVNTPYQPGTIKPAPIDISASASQGFDKSSLSWWK